MPAHNNFTVRTPGRKETLKKKKLRFYPNTELAVKLKKQTAM